MTSPLSERPSKIIAVHVSYRSRAKERGVMPAWPSYFLKPPSSLAASGDLVARPPGCELLAYEGEVALIIGRKASRVERGAAWDHVRWITAANDFGVYDMRHADRGGNLRSKGVDGLTPIGPRLLDARAVDPVSVRLRTWVNGDLTQDALSCDELLFSFDDLVADLTRLMTLEPGDVILTGTPAGSSVVGPGDVVEVEVSSADVTTGRLSNQVVEAGYRLGSFGAMPEVTGQDRDLAYGTFRLNGNTQPGRSPLAPEVLVGLGQVSTATLASQLRRRGMNGMTLDGLRSTKPGHRMIGFARTLRYLPLREDMFARRGAGMNAQKQAVEQIRPGEVLVIEARQDPTAGTIGDILALRAQARGAAGIVTDGAVRDSIQLAALDIPTYRAAIHPAVLGRRHTPWDTGCAVACAGVAVQPGDLLVGDDDGVLVVPTDLAAAVLADAQEQERQEEFAAAQVAAGAAIDGLYPLGERWHADYEAWLKERAGS